MHGRRDRPASTVSFPPYALCPRTTSSSDVSSALVRVNARREQQRRGAGGLAPQGALRVRREELFVHVDAEQRGSVRARRPDRVGCRRPGGYCASGRPYGLRRVDPACPSAAPPPRCRPSQGCGRGAGEAALPARGTAPNVVATAALSSMLTTRRGQRGGCRCTGTALVDEDDVAHGRDLPQELVDLGELVARGSSWPALQEEERPSEGCRAAGMTAIRSEIRRPSGRARSSGTVRRPHRAATSRIAHGFSRTELCRCQARGSRGRRPSLPRRRPGRALRRRSAGSRYLASRARGSPGAAAREAPTERRRAYRCRRRPDPPRVGQRGRR